MKGTPDTCALDRPAMSQVGAEMGTVGILYMGLAVFGAEGDKLTSKVMERKDCADRKFVGERDWKPTSRIGRQRRTLIFHGSSFS